MSHLDNGTVLRHCLFYNTSLDLGDGRIPITVLFYPPNDHRGLCNQRQPSLANLAEKH